MKKVILIDDDPGIRDVFKIVFERAGYSVTILSGADTILKSRFEEPDIFIIDKQLSGADGVEVCRFLKHRRSNSHTPVIVFSASTRIDRYAIDAGADDFLEKPFKTAELLAMVERLTAA